MGRKIFCTPAIRVNFGKNFSDHTPPGLIHDARPVDATNQHGNAHPEIKPSAY